MEADQMTLQARLREAWKRQARSSGGAPHRLQKLDPQNDDLKLLAGNYEDHRELTRKLRSARKRADLGARTGLLQQVTTLEENREAIIESYLDGIQNQIDDPRFSINLTSHPMGKHTIFEFSEPKAAGFFAEKMLQDDLRNKLGIATPGRDLVIEKLVRVLGDTEPKTLVRADVKDFYGTIDHGTLLSKLKTSSRMSGRSVRLVETLLAQTRAHSTHPEPRGVPRGIGISALLAEFYMLEFDRRILENPSTVFYARYVDDIVAVFSSRKPRASSHANYIEFLSSELSREKLTISPKTEKIYEESFTPDRASLPPMTFLGYEIEARDNSPEVRISSNRFDRLIHRVDTSFMAHSLAESKNKSSSSVLRADHLLARRIRFLTSNTRLHNNKSLAHVGIRSSNSHVTDTSQLTILDDHLASRAASLSNKQLARKIGEFSFLRGFSEYTFHRWTPKQLSEITSLWRPHARSS